MSTIPSVFSVWQILITAAIAFLASALALSNRQSKFLSLHERMIVAGVVGVSVLVWRLSGNVAALNDDPIPAVSPNDVLSPVVTYVSLGLYAAFRPPTDKAIWEKNRAWLTLISFVVNVLFI